MRYLYLPVLTLLCLTASQLPAQQTTVRTPLGTSSSSFFEQNSVNWSGNWGGLWFQFGGGPATPTFGNFAPGAGLSTSFDVSRGNFNAKFNLGMSQGSRQSLTSQCPVVTLTDGQPGFVSDTSQTPFVIGEIPVVGGIPLAGFNPMAALGDMAPPPTQGNPAVQKMAQAVARGAQPPAKAGNPGARNADVPRSGAAADSAAGPRFARQLAAAQESSAGRPAPSVAEARRLHALDKAAEGSGVGVLMERGRTAEEEGKPGVAKIYYQMVVKRASGDLKAQAQQRLDALRGPAAP